MNKTMSMMVLAVLCVVVQLMASVYGYGSPWAIKRSQHNNKQLLYDKNEDRSLQKDKSVGMTTLDAGSAAVKREFKMSKISTGRRTMEVLRMLQKMRQLKEIGKRSSSSTHEENEIKEDEKRDISLPESGRRTGDVLRYVLKLNKLLNRSGKKRAFTSGRRTNEVLEDMMKLQQLMRSGRKKRGWPESSRNPIKLKKILKMRSRRKKRADEETDDTEDTEDTADDFKVILANDFVPVFDDRMNQIGEIGVDDLIDQIDEDSKKKHEGSAAKGEESHENQQLELSIESDHQNKDHSNQKANSVDDGTKSAEEVDEERMTTAPAKVNEAVEDELKNIDAR